MTETVPKLALSKTRTLGHLEVFRVKENEDFHSLTAQGMFFKSPRATGGLRSHCSKEGQRAVSILTESSGESCAQAGPHVEPGTPFPTCHAPAVRV